MRYGMSGGLSASIRPNLATVELMPLNFNELGDFGQFGFALDQREQAAFPSSADNCITLPARDDSRALGNVDSIRDQAGPGVLAGTFL